MKTMRRRGRGGRTALTAGLVAAAGLLATTVAAAQEDRARLRTECRCVDADGHEIDDCTCLRTPSPRTLSRSFMLYGDSRARLGISVSTAQSASMDAAGARLQSVTRNGPADEAGLREGDVITRLDGHGLLDPLDADTERDFDLDRSVPVQRLLAIARDLEPGQEVEVQYERDGQTHTTTVEARELSGWGALDLRAPAWERHDMADRVRELGDRMRSFQFEAPEGRFHLWADSTDGGRFRVLGSPGADVYFFGGVGGLELIELKPGLAGYFGVEGGVLVADAPEDSPLGLQPGDVVLEVGDRDVDTPAHLRRILRSYQQDEEITFRIMRHEREMSVRGHLTR
jgi:hypothetical protein